MQITLKSLVGFGGVMAIAYLGLCVAIWKQQTRLIYFPSSLIETRPQAFDLPFQDVWLPLRSDGKVEHMHGWWIPANRVEQGVILYLHGNGLNIGANLVQAQRFHQLGWSVFLPDYRGYGQSEGGFPTEAKLYQDAATAWKYLTETRGIAANEIVLFGHSLGGAVAIELATHHPQIAGLIIQSSFSSMRAMVDHRGQFAIFPVGLILNQHFDSLNRVRSLPMPILYIHGMADSIIPYQMSQSLHASTRSEKQLYLVPGAGHNNVGDIGGVAYMQTLNQFLGRVKHQPPKTSVSYSGEKRQ